jgi:tyrosinase
MDKLTPADFETELTAAQTSRRVFVKGLGFVSAALLMGSLGGCDKLAEAIRNRPTRRRLRTGSAAVDADIATYRDAVAAMKALPASDPRSWAAQAAIHGTVTGGFYFCEHGTDHFFDWHRAYLLYFERICQKLTGNPKFGLPYWNWNQNVDIHPAFLDTASTLFLSRTRNSMAGASAITTTALDPIFADANFFTFRQQLEGTPHNTVHTFIGQTMGSGGSALDPLFWVHHCMVDYCWYKWNVDLGNDNTNDSAWISHSDTHFVDVDGNPASTTAGLTTIMPLLSYQYESSAIGSHPAVGTITTKSAFQRIEKRVREGANVRFEIKQRLHLADRLATSIAKPVSVETKLSAADFSRIIESNAASERIFATIQFAQLPATSDFSVRVFVNLPGANRNTPNTDPHYAGSFAFFGTSTVASAPASEHAQHRHQPQFLVDLTATVQRLRQRQELKADAPISIQLVPTPFADQFEREDTELMLTNLDVIVTPVVVSAARR